eukprot:TRINITY_DN8788_c0_g1_i3.p1 TRINITY_DN8788_c0_g1~~TRINITY_DN8788_c0_g1_i3.p1  ORF type:complete len:284 (-),score=53.87 TRINITY_DN8788_c0_g1_i3:142-993(-)
MLKGDDSFPVSAPWQDLDLIDPVMKDEVARKILEIAKTPRNLLNVPPQKSLDLSRMVMVASAALDGDPELSRVKNELVPKHLDDESFWRNYFYRVDLIRISYGLPPILNLTPGESVQFLQPSNSIGLEEESNSVHVSEITSANSRAPIPEDVSVLPATPSFTSTVTIPTTSTTVQRKSTEGSVEFGGKVHETGTNQNLDKKPEESQTRPENKSESVDENDTTPQKPIQFTGFASDFYSTEVAEIDHLIENWEEALKWDTNEGGTEALDIDFTTIDGISDDEVY